MRRSRNIARSFGLILALVGLTSSAASQNNPPNSPIWSSSGPGAAVYSLAIDPSNPNTIYAGTGNGVFKSTDGGASWRFTNVAGDITVALVIDRGNPNTIYAATAFTNFCDHSYRRLFKSVDGGASWSDGVSPPINGCDNIHALVLAPNDPHTLYVANFDDSFGDTFSPLVKSINGGATWSPLFGTPFAALAIDPQHPSTLYGGTFDFTYFGYDGLDPRNGVLKSTDGGVNWSTTGLTNTAVEVLAIDPVNPSTLYAATKGFYSAPYGFRGLFKSTDSGANWSASNNGLAHLLGTNSDQGRPPALGRANVRTSLVIDPDNSSTLYAGLPSGGVFKSIDGGANWSAFNDGLTNLDVRVLTLAPGNPNTLYAGTASGVFKIIDNTSPTNPIDDAQFFVRQHYLDFLAREPEQSGLDDWLRVLHNCPAGDAECLHQARLTTSAAFFGSPEFQLKGYFVFRFYRAAFDRLPTFAEIIPDMQSVAGQTPAEVYAAKAAFTNAFTQRPGFVNQFGALANAAYVTVLLSRYQLASITTPDPFNPDGAAKVTLTPADLVARLDSNSLTRAQVLRAIADSDEVLQREFNRAFVAMQYYGYLRRTPEAAGYNAWLTYLTAHPTDSRTMVRGFVDSVEYRARFGRP